MNNPTSTETGYNWKVMVLCLEGGGVKGFASLLMLEKLMAKIAEIESNSSPPKGVNIDASEWEPHNSSFAPDAEEPKPPRLIHNSSSFTRGRRRGKATSSSDLSKEGLRKKMEIKEGKYLPCHYFDYIGGTSTGGLTALMLGRLRLEVKECLEHYQDMSQHIFGSWRLSLKGLLKPRYSSKPMEKEIQDIVENTLPRNDNNSRCRRLAAPDDLCKTVVFAALEDKPGPYLFRTYKNEAAPGSEPDNAGLPQDCEIWQAARATSAAPGYLKPMIMEKDGPVYIDGAMACNDPTPQLIKELKTHRRWHTGQELGVKLVLTLGTGHKPTKKVKARGFAASHFGRYSNTLKTHLLKHGKAEEKMLKYKKMHGFAYFKWDGGLQIEAVSLDDCKAKTFSKMSEWTDAYMNQPAIVGKAGRENDGELWEVATSLVEERRNRLLRSQRKWARFASCNTYRCPLSTCLKKPNIFNSRQEVENHIMHQHNSSPEMLAGIEVVSPCLRGPWCHEVPEL